MAHFTATDAKNNFGLILNTAQRETVFIEKNGYQVAAMISDVEYKRLLDIENSLLILQAKATKEKGFIGEDKSEALLKDLLNAKD